MLDKIKLQNAVRKTGKIPSNSMDTLLAQALSASADLVSESKMDTTTIAGEANTKISENASAISSLKSTTASQTANIASNAAAIENVSNNLTNTQNDVATNAANIEAVTAIVSTATEDITQLKTDVAKNANAIAANASVISDTNTAVTAVDNKVNTLESKVDANAAQAANDKTALEESIATNASAISSNASDIDDLATRVTATESDISALQTSVTNLNDIKADLVKVNENAEYIRTNASNIETLQTTVENIQSIKADVDLVQANATRIANNLTQIETNALNITNLTTTVNGHTDALETVGDNIATLQERIAANESSIATNGTNIAAVSSRVTATESDLDTAKTDIDNLESTVATATATLSTHGSNITELYSKDAALDTDISNINLALDQKATKSELQEAKALITTAQTTADSATGTANEAKVLATANASSLAELAGTVAGKANSATVSTLGDRVNIAEDNISSLQTSVSNLSTNKADKTEIPDVSNFATRDELPTEEDYATKDEYNTLSGKVDELETLKADVTAVNENAEYIRTNASNLATLSETVANLNEVKANVTAVQETAAAVQANADRIEANLANITSNTEAVSNLTSRVSILEGSGHLTAATLPDHLSGLVAVDGTNVTNAKHKIITKKNNKDITAMIWNETSGGGAQMKNENADKISFVGVNNGDGDKEIWVQAYAKQISNNTGVRMTLTTDKMYYTKNQANGNYTDDDEIVTVKDLPVVPSIEGLASEEYVNNKVDSIVIPDISGLAAKTEVAAVDAKVDALEIPSIEGLATETYVDNKVDSIQIPSVAGLASEAYVDAKVAAVDLTPYVEKNKLSGLVAVNGTNASSASHVVQSTENDKAVKSFVWNEKSGGGSRMENYNANVKSFVGVNNGNAGKNPDPVDKQIWVQQYAKDMTTGIGARTALSTLGFYYTKNKPNGTYEATDEVVTLKDLNTAVDGLASETYVDEKFASVTHPVEGLATEEYVDNAVAAITHPTEGLATTQYVDNAVAGIVHPTVDLTPYAEIDKLSGLVAVDGVNATEAKHKVITKKNNKDIISMLWNEKSGGGSQMRNENADKISYVGVNNGDGDKEIWVQQYAKSISTNVGARTALSTTGFFYTKNKNGSSYDANDEVVTIKDLPDISGIASNTGDLIMLLSRLENLEVQLKAMKHTAVQSVDINSAASSTLINDTVDFVCSDTTVESKVVTVSGKSIDIADTEITSSRLALTASEDVELTNVSSDGNLAKSVSNAAVSINNNGYVKITDNNFEQTGYNSIEIGLTATNAPKGVLIDNCTFGEMSNNTISIFNTVDNAVVTISNCHFGKASNPIRISNRDNVRMTLNVINCTFDEYDTDALDYRAMMICQDYTSTSDAMAMEAKRFGPDKITVNVINCIDPSGNKIVEPEDMSQILGSQSCANPLIYVYYNKGGLQPYSAEVYPAVHIS